MKGFLLNALFLLIFAGTVTECGIRSSANEAWELTKIITKGESYNSQEDIIEVKHCDGLPEKKSFGCTAGKVANIGFSVGGNFGVSNVASISSEVSSELGFEQGQSETLDLETPPSGHIYKYKILTSYKVLSGEGEAYSDKGGKAKVTYVFKASCKLEIVPPREDIFCKGSDTTTSITVSPAVQAQSIQEPTTTEVLSIAQEPSVSETLPPLDGSEESQSKDGMELIYIPSGKFVMGAGNSDSGAYESEMPQNTISLDSYWIDKYEITNAMYKLCVQASVCSPPSDFQSSTHSSYYGNSRYDQYPVINITWFDANTYCKWAGRRLPTEAEWEKAARGTDARIFHWGNEFGGNLANYNNNKLDTTQVGSFPGGSSFFGLLDMAGNVWEWVADWYQASYYKEMPLQNPTGPSSGSRKIVRGGGFKSTYFYLRISYRFGWDPEYYDNNIGFRCASTP